MATRTSDGTFTTLAGGDVTVPMLHGTHNSVPRFQGTNYEMADLIYDGAKVVMTILVPAAGQFEAVRGALTHAWLEQARATPAAAAGMVSVTVPKFRFTWGTKTFKDSLQSLGMTDAFIYGTADFSGMEPTRQLFLGNVYHKTFVGVDENGTEAAAATAATMIGGGTTPIPAFAVDRPFFFFIRDATGALLFAGQVVDPTAN
jgi:serpin B